MSFQKHKSEENIRDFKLSLKSPNGNTVAYVFLSNAFSKSVTGKSNSDVCYEDISAINNGDIISYLKGLDIEVERVVTETIEASNF